VNDEKIFSENASAPYDQGLDSFPEENGTGQLEEQQKTWDSVSSDFGLTTTQSVDEALNFVQDTINSWDAFPADWSWIARINQLAREINQMMQEWHGQEAHSLESVIPITNIINREDYNRDLSKFHKRNFTQNIDIPDLPPHVLNLFQGDPCILLRNVSKMSGLVKGRGRWASDLGQRVVVVRFENQEEVRLPIIPMEKTINGGKFCRWQVPVRPIYAGIGYRIQGITLA
jgi:hypothetical protein